MLLATVGWDWILTVITAMASIAGSTWAIRAIIKHEMKNCDDRMEAFKEGLEHGEKNR